MDVQEGDERAAVAAGDESGSTAAATVQGDRGPIPAPGPESPGSGGPTGVFRRPRVLLGLTGSVASIKAPELARLLARWADVRVVATRPALAFFDPADLPAEAGEVLGDEAEWREWRRVGDPVLHIELRRWADVLLVAPLGANSLAKLAYGLCDNLLTCVARAWDHEAGKPIVLAPAMNTAMWSNPMTAAHLRALGELPAFRVVQPIAKRLACADVGVGAMAEPADIDAAVRAILAPLAGGLGIEAPATDA